MTFLLHLFGEKTCDLVLFKYVEQEGLKKGELCGQRYGENDMDEYKTKLGKGPTTIGYT